MNWEKYEPGDPSSYIPVEEWGQDHWATFAYLETVAVDKKGIVDNRKMRCNPRLHRELANLGALGDIIDGSKYPTRLKAGQQAEKHDDWSCLEDMIAAGLIESWYRVKRRREVFGGNEAKVKLTPLGQEIAGKLRAHRANGGKWSEFELERITR